MPDRWFSQLQVARRQGASKPWVCQTLKIYLVIEHYLSPHKLHQQTMFQIIQIALAQMHEQKKKTGAVFTIGRSRFADNIASHFFIRKDPVLTITCGDEHSAVVCQSGRLFVFGSNDWGQLGLGHKNHVSKPSCVKILKPEKVTHVACGRAHTLICTGGQKIFACGSDQEGQLGRGNAAIGDSASTPVLVYDCGLAGPRVVQIAAGSHHSMALTSDGGVIAWGSNLEGQLGLSGISGLVNKPTKVPISEPVKEISTGYYHSAFLTESGLVYVCGESESGKLGIDVNFSTQVAPKQMLLPTTAIHIACGGHHTLVLTESGNVYCVGSNASGQLGMGTNVTEVSTPKLLSRDALKDQSIVKIACGESHSAVLTESGKFYTCGDGRHGKLGLEENENNVHELTFAVKYQELFISNVSCGGCHTILLGKRRETSNQTELESESVQDHQIQKKNPLPPLKLPVNRLQTENHTDKMNEVEKESTENENILEKTTSEESSENKLDDVKDNSSKTPKDSMNNIEKPEIPTTNDEPEETTPKIMEEEKTEDTSEKKDVENNNDEDTTKTNNTSNVDIEKQSESMTIDAESNNMEEKTDEIAKTEEPKIEDETETSPEKPASPDPTPPPKPPRQKIGSPQGSAGETTELSNKSSENEDKKEDSLENNSKTNESKESEESVIKSMTEETNKEEESPAKVSINSHKSRSMKSNADIEETVIPDPQNVLDEVKAMGKMIKNEKNDEEHIQDDADVIQSPAPRTGKMAKLFKGKKQQEIENGTKSSGTTNSKSKRYVYTMADINTDNNDPEKSNERFSRNRGRGSGSKNRDGFFKHSDRRNEFYNSRGSNRSESYRGSSSNDNNFNKKPYKRNWTPPQGDGKRKRLEVGNRLKEPDIGVTEFIGDHLGFPGLVKERYSDFHVNEIFIDGKVVKLTNQVIPSEPEETETLDDLKKCVPDNIWEQLQTLKEEESSSSTVEIDVTDVHKDVRRTIHEIAKRLANVTSQTIDKNNKKLMVMIKTNKENKSRDDHRFRLDDRVNWKKLGGDYCYFLLHKVNMDTMDALNQMAMILRIRPNNFSYAGTKDRRAWTTQWISLKKTPPKKILRAGFAIRGAYVGNFKFEKAPLKLGMLKGNRFKIAIRNVIAPNEEIEKAMISFRDRGFINYYGLQRFGTVAAIPTHEIGKKLLQSKWHEAIDLILKPREGERDQGLIEARKIYETTKDANAACKKIQRSDKIEATLLKGLVICTDKNPQGALDMLPRNIRLMYIHAYQSFIWNQIVSKRIKEFGTRPIVGDLVYQNKLEEKCSEENSEQSCQDNTEDAILDNDETNNSAKENQDEMVPETHEEDIKNDDKESNNDIKEVTNATEISLKIEEKGDESNTVENKEEQEELCHIPSVKILTEEDLPNYTLDDIIMPQPGWKVTYPPYAKPWFDEILAKDGLTTDLRQNNKKYSLGGAYRKILQVPMDLSWKIMHYKAKHDNLISSDIDEMRKVTPPKDDPEGEFKALIVEMSLNSSTYATMALREILKHDTSPQIQAAQSAAHDALLENNKTNDSELETNNSDNKDTQEKEIEKKESERSNEVEEKMDIDLDSKESAVEEKCLAESEIEMQVEPVVDEVEMS
ncbi:hypothetical protein M0802_003472 [Mischocyttarus mexicanus]|nr:hypothetical protein M0802_003472 [Mischocyttarus mexicanus]